MKLCIIARGGGVEGFGHVVRSTAVAEAARARAHSVTHIVVRAGFADQVVRLGSTASVWLDTDDDAAAAVRAAAPDLIAFDTTHFEVARLTPQPLWASLSPVFSEMSRVRAVFSRSSDISFPPGVRVFAGLDYCVVSPSVARIGDEVYDFTLEQPRLGVAIAFGGTDPDGYTVACLSALAKASEPRVFWAVVGDGYSSKLDALEKLVSASPHELVIVRGGPSLWKILGGSSLLVAGGGLTAYEAAHAGLPAIHAVASPAQLSQLRSLTDAGAIVHAEVRDYMSTGKIAALVDRLSRDRQRLRHVRNASRVIDVSRGAVNCVVALEELVRNSSHVDTQG